MMPHYKSIFSSHEVRVLVLRTTPFKFFCEDQKRQILKIALGATHSHLLKFLVFKVGALYATLTLTEDSGFVSVAGGVEVAGVLKGELGV